MTTDFSIALQELLDKSNADTDFLREAVRVLTQALMDLEVSRQIGAGRQKSVSESVAVLRHASAASAVSMDLAVSATSAASAAWRSRRA